jgi:hypothetical protein
VKSVINVSHRSGSKSQKDHRAHEAFCLSANRDQARAAQEKAKADEWKSQRIAEEQDEHYF